MTDAEVMETLAENLDETIESCGGASGFFKWAGTRSLNDLLNYWEGMKGAPRKAGRPSDIGQRQRRLARTPEFAHIFAGKLGLM